jgi:hypothetical protein
MFEIERFAFYMYNDDDYLSNKGAGIVLTNKGDRDDD